LLRDASKRLARRVGLLETGRQLRDALRAWRHRLRERRRDLPPDGLPVPSARLILKVAGTPDARWFLGGGRLAADSIRAALARHGIDLDALPSLLDFGCGCGRVVRHWRGLRGEVHGTDYEGAGVEWCRRHLPFGRFARNELRPPLAYASGHFAFIYALSVFTHLPAELQEPWMSELSRVLAPGGHLLISLHGTAYEDGLSPPERALYDAGQLVVRYDAPGGNACGAYHPPDYIRNVLARGFQVLEITPRGAAGNPWQDLVLLRKPG
jgi:SAM-dependent methyltransferase